MKHRKIGKWGKPIISLALAAILMLSMVLGTFPAMSATTAAGLYTNVKFSKPAICCDVGQTIDLASCGVQFTANALMTTSGITWQSNGSTVRTFTPSAKGVYALTAKAGGNTKTVYVVAKNPEETKYVLYRNEFDAIPPDYRIPQKPSNVGITVKDGNLVLDASGSADSYIRILLPQFLDAFGDATFTASMKMTSAVDNNKWASLMYRVQSGNYPYYHAALRKDATQSSGAEISQRNASDAWEVHSKTSFGFAYAGYHDLGEDITVVGCWAHARRKFDEAVKSLPKGKAKGSSASQGLTYCNLLFGIEQEIAEKTAEERYEERLKQAKPVLDAMFAWAKHLLT